jgi:transcription elongation factor Elf1
VEQGLEALSGDKKGGRSMVTEEKESPDLKISFSCPVCAHKTDYPITQMVEGAILSCSLCKLTIKLHGHMLQEVQREIEKLGKKR